MNGKTEETYPERAKCLGREVGRQLQEAAMRRTQKYLWTNFGASELAEALCARGYGTGEELYDELTTRESDPFSDKDAETLIDLLRRV